MSTRSNIRASARAVLVLAAPWLALALVATEIQRVSVDSAGGQGDGVSLCRPAISADGRFVAFSSAASNLVPGDTNGVDDVFVHDRLTGITARVSLAHDGAQANGWCRNPAISADGRFVAYVSVADNLVPGDTNGAWDVFVHDRQENTVERISLAHDGTQARHGFLRHEITLRDVPMTDDPQRYPPAISADGRFVVFVSDAPNLVPDDNNGKFDVLVRDRQTATTTRVSVATGGGEADGGSHHAVISADGRFVVFNSGATNLVPDDTNGRWDTFIHDRDTGVTERISLAHDGIQANGESVGIPAVSADGRFVAFTSHADNLVVNDTNRQSDVFRRDRQEDTTIRISLRANGFQAHGAAFHPAISADGRRVVFTSNALNAVPGIVAGSANIFLADLDQGSTACVSLTAKLKPSRGRSLLPMISAGGSVVTFASEADDLVAGDTNGVADIFARGGAMTDFTLTLQVAPPGGGQVVPSVPVNVAPWATVDIAAAPAVSHDFAGWSVISGAATISDANAPATTVVLAADSVLAANFAPHSYPVTFQLAPVPANAHLSGDLAQTVIHGGAATPVAAHAPEGYRFVKWTHEGMDFATDNPITVSGVTALLALVANFAPEHLDFHQVTFVAEGEGTILGDAIQVVAHGANCAPVTALPAAGRQLVAWMRNGRAYATSPELTVAGVTADLALVAKFAPENEIYHTVAFVAGTGGTLDGDILQVLRDGEHCTPIVAVPDADSQFLKWAEGQRTIAATPTVAFGPVLADATLDASFALATEEWCTVTFLADGPGSLIGEQLQVVRALADCSPVTMQPDAGSLFRGWTGDFTGKVNPLVLVRIRRDLNVTANFLDSNAVEPLACGIRFEIPAADVGLRVFTVMPQVAGHHYLPNGPHLQEHRQQSAVRIIQDLPAGGAPMLAGEWLEAVRLYDAAAFRQAQRSGTTADEWLGFVDAQPLLALDLMVSTSEADPRDRLLRPAVLVPPRITVEPVVADGILVVAGEWFGTGRRKVWLEAVTHGVVRRIRLKVLPPNDPELKDADGTIAYMNAADGVSGLTAVMPGKYPRGITPADVRAVVIENVVGLATHPLAVAP